MTGEFRPADGLPALAETDTLWGSPPRLPPPRTGPLSDFRRLRPAMTIDKSLKVKAGSVASRSVLTRVERIEKLRESERWNDASSPFGLPKVRVRKLQLKKKKKTKEKEDGK